jgi:hypothetical protein
VKVRLNDSDLVGTGVEVGRSSLFRGDHGGGMMIRKLRIDRGIQLPEKCKENVDVSSKGPSSGS